MKTQLSHQDIYLIFLIVTLIYALAVSNSAASQDVTIHPILNTNVPKVNEVAAGTNLKINRMILSHEVKIVTNEPSNSKNQNSLKRQMVIQAKKDLAHRLSVKADEIRLLEARKVTWPDSSLGCPQPGKVYNQILQDGFLIRLEFGQRMYFYHGGRTPDPFLCEQTSQVVPHPTKVDEFVPPPGSDID